jgi:spermidine synthase
MILWLLAIGLISMLGQVLLLRELNVAFYGSELIYILALGIWLLWTATGAALGRRAAVPSGELVRLLLLAHGLALPLVIVLVRGLRPLLGGVPGAYLPFHIQLLAMSLALLPVGIMLGLLFQWAAKLYVRDSRTLAGAYGIESAGGLAGGLLATMLLKIGMQNLTAALLCALLSVAAGCHPWHPRRPRWLLPAAVTAALPLLIVILWSGPLDRRLTSWNHPHLVESVDSPYGRVTITERDGQLSVFENDALAFESEGTTAEEFAHLAAIQHPAPRMVLLLGGGVEGLVSELLLHRPERVDYVELNGRLFDLFADRMPERERLAFASDTVDVTIADPRRFLDRDRRYDLILIGMPEPASGQANRFYTEQFFSRCSERLRAGGLLALRLPGAENLWTPHRLRRASSIKSALDAVFADSVVLPGVTNIFFASDQPLSRDPSVPAERLTERGIRGRLVIPAYVNYLYTNDRFHELASLLDEETAPINSDLRPVCYQYTLLIWLSKFFPVLAMLELPEIRASDLFGSVPSWIALGALLPVLILARRLPRLRRLLLAAVAGFAGMILETALILNYQIQRGVLYQDLGLLLTAFMAGLAIGAAMMARRARHGAPGGPIGAALLAGLAGLALLMYVLLGAGMVGGLPSSSLLLFVSGFFVAGIFAYASLQHMPDQRLVISPLYAADLFGGAIGSLVATLFLIPVFGLPASALLTAIIVAIALLLA